MICGHIANRQKEARIYIDNVIFQGDLNDFVGYRCYISPHEEYIRKQKNYPSLALLISVNFALQYKVFYSDKDLPKTVKFDLILKYESKSHSFEFPIIFSTKNEFSHLNISMDSLKTSAIINFHTFISTEYPIYINNLCQLEKSEIADWKHKIIGKGSYGDVFLITSPRSKRYALKYLKETFSNYHTTSSTIREILPLIEIDQHPCIISLKRVVRLSNVHLGLVLEFAEYKSLHEFIKTRHQNWNDTKKIKYFLGLCSAILYLNSFGYIHRDLKSLNVLVNSKLECKLNDFGASRFLNEKQFDFLTRNVSTINFSSPEMQSNQYYDYSTDIYSLGIILLEIILGKTSFIAKIINDHSLVFEMKCISQATKALIYGMIQNNPIERPLIDEIIWLIRNGIVHLPDTNLLKIYKFSNYLSYYENKNLVQRNDFHYYRKSCKNRKNDILIAHCGFVLYLNNEFGISSSYLKLSSLLGNKHSEYLFHYLIIEQKGVAIDSSSFSKLTHYDKLDFQDYFSYLLPPNHLSNNFLNNILYHEKEQSPYSYNYLFKYYFLEENDFGCAYQNLKYLDNFDPVIPEMISVESNKNAEYLIKIAKIFEKKNFFSYSIMMYEALTDFNYAEGLYKLGKCYYYGKGVDKSVDEAIKYFKLSCNEGYPPAQYMIAKFQYEGLLCEPNYVNALYLLRISANQGYFKSQDLRSKIYSFMLKLLDIPFTGLAEEKLCLTKFVGCPPVVDINETILYFRYWTLNENPVACFNLGIAYLNGYGVKVDEYQAFLFFKDAAALKYRPAQIAAQKLREKCEVIYNTTKEMIPLFERAAYSNVADAQIEMGFIYRNGVCVEKDYDKAESFYRMASDQGNKFAQAALVSLLLYKGDIWKAIDEYDKSEKIYMVNHAAYKLAMFYHMGELIEKDEARAFELFKLSSKCQIYDSMYILGLYYYDGIIVEKSISKALEYFMKAAEHGSINALNMIGYMYGKGESVTQDDFISYHYYMLAATQGNKVGQYNCGLKLLYGKGVEKDVSKAYKLFRLSEAQDYGLARQILNTYFV